MYFQAKQTYMLAQSEDDLRHALAQTTKAVDLDPRFAEVFALRSMLYDDLQMQTKAQEAIAKALELAPNLGSAHFALGRLLVGEYDLLRAEKEFQRALELDPERWSATESIAMIEAFRGQFTQSIEGQQRAVHRGDRISHVRERDRRAGERVGGDDIRRRVGGKGDDVNVGGGAVDSDVGRIGAIRHEGVLDGGDVGGGIAGEG